jgi:hypothetical protein
VQEYNYDLNNVIDLDPENDEKWGIPGLHKIRPKIQRETTDPMDFLTKSEYNYCRQITVKLFKMYGLENKL